MRPTGFKRETVNLERRWVSQDRTWSSATVLALAMAWDSETPSNQVHHRDQTKSEGTSQSVMVHMVIYYRIYPAVSDLNV